MNNPTDLEAYLCSLKTELSMFLQRAFEEIYPNKAFVDNWHIDAIVHCLEQAIQGKMPRLIINLPPRQLKSFITSVVLPAFILGQDPSAKIICVSYSDDLAKTLARDFRRIVESAWYHRIFPNVVATKSTESDFVTDMGGSRYAISVCGSLTGKGADFIIIDDPIKPDDTQSDKLRQTVNEWFKSTLLSRLDDKKHSVLIVVMQRLHVNDLTGYVEGTGNFHKLSLPAIAYKDEWIPIGNGDEYPRLKGDVLHDEWEDLVTINNMRLAVGEFIFMSQYQQDPQTPDGSIIKNKYLQIILSTDFIALEGIFWVSIDAAAALSDSADYSAISVGYSNKNGHFILKVERGRFDYETLKEKCLAYAAWRKVTFIVENAGPGISLLNFLRKNGYPNFSHNPSDDKIARAAKALPIFDAKRVFLVKNGKDDEWIPPFINELVNFPNGRYDDQVDSLVQAIRWAERRVNPGGDIYFFGS